MSATARPIGNLKLSELKPCALCHGPLRKDRAIQWVLVRHSMVLLNPRETNEVVSMTQYFGGALGLAEAMAPSDKPVYVMAEQEGGAWDEAHICFDCWYSPELTKLRRALGLSD